MALLQFAGWEAIGKLKQMSNVETFSNGHDGPAAMARSGLHDRVFDLVNEHYPNRSRIADLAAGQGAFSIRLRDLGHEITAIDGYSDAWKVPDIELKIQNLDSEFAADLVADDNKYDAVVAIEIIEHLENPFRFARECAKLLKPGGLLFLTTPNVESVYSRIIFFYTGRLNSFGSYETVRPAHITPIFKWKLDMLLNEAGFSVIHEEFDQEIFGPSANFKVRCSLWLAKLIAPFVKGSKGGNGRIVVAKLY